MTRLAISTPYLWTPFRDQDTELPYAERIKPFNFLLTAHVAPMGHPAGVDKTRFLLVAPYEANPKQWNKLRWTDVHSQEFYNVTPFHERKLYHPNWALVQTYRGSLQLFRVHPEPKSARADGLPCDELNRNCAGLLQQRRHAFVPRGHIDNIGKEMNELDSVLADVAHNEDDIVTRYPHPAAVPFDSLRVLLRCIPRPELEARSGLSQRTIERARRGTRTPHPKNQARLSEAVRSYAFDGGQFSFAAIERLDPLGIDAEIAEVVRASPIFTRKDARSQIATAHARRITLGLAALGIAAL